MTDRRVEQVALALLPFVALAAVVPVGWDRTGPIRWLGLPVLGFALVAVVLGRPTAAPPRVAAPGLLGLLDIDRLATGAWLVILGWGAVAAAFGADPLHAWIGTPDRRFGWLTWLLCAGLFAVGRRLGPATADLVLRSTAIGAVALGLHTLAQWIGLLDDGGFDGGRLGGPLGQPAYLGAAAALAAPVAAGLAADARASTRWRAVGAAGAAGALGAALLSQSRAAWLGLAAASALLVAARFVGGLRATAETEGRNDGGTASDDSGAGSVEAGNVGAAGLPGIGWAVLALPAVAVVAIPTLRDRLTGAAADGGVIDGRLAEWRVGLRALGASPLVGHGPEGYRTVFGVHVDEGYVIDWGRDVITDRAHNGLLDTGLALGLPGLVAAAVLLGAVGVAAARATARGPAPVVGSATGVVAYAVAQQFLFPLSELDPLFWLLAGLVLGHHCDAVTLGPDDPIEAAGENPAATRAAAAPTGVTAAVRGLAIGLALVAGLAGTADLVADADVAAVLDGANRGQPIGDRADPEPDPAPDPDPDLALALRPDSIRYQFLASRIAGRRGDVDLALARVEAGLDRSPADPALRGERASLLIGRARATEGGPARREALAEAVVVLRDVVATDPLHPRHLQALGIALALTGELDEAEIHLERAVELAPDDPDAAANLAVLRDLQNGA